ncbi:MAG TPA: acetate--CoA ligase family protein, partial [Longimicrobiales bacterium]|nr:acetate--CoA ligase family protein [Longimicrobiales bacterium]
QFLAAPPWAPRTGEAAPSASPVVRAARSRGRDILTEPEARALLEAGGVTFPPAAVCATAAEAVAAAARWDGPVALKVVSPLIPHKSDAGGVALGLSGAADVSGAFVRVTERCGDHLAAHGHPRTVPGVLVSPMQPRPLAELLVGAYRDPDVGPVLSIGAGGVWVEVLEDVAHRVLPVDAREVRAMLSELRVSRVLSGGRGRPAADVDAVVDAALAVARCVMDHPEVAEVEINPLFVYARGAVPVDARVYLTATPSA